MLHQPFFLQDVNDVNESFNDEIIILPLKSWSTVVAALLLTDLFII